MDQIDPAALAVVNEQHLNFLEAFLANEQFIYLGVPLALPFAYELIQLMNHAYLKSVLEPTTGGQQ